MAARKTKPKPAAEPAGDGVTLRLYCHGLGDCHLIGFPKSDGGTFWMLIDCGIHSSAAGGTETIRRVATDLKARTGGRIDVVVGTHEHWDHISGFVQARDLFAGIEIGEVWFGWTEDPADPLARQLDRFKGEALAALADATLRLADDKRMGAAGAAMDTLLGFTSGLAGEKSRDARETLRGMGKTVRHLQPGSIAPLPDLPNVRVHVLGPPRDLKLLGIEDSPSDTYRIGPGGNGSATVRALTNAIAVGEGRLRIADDALAPFDQTDGIGLSTALARTDMADPETAFLSRHYAGPGALMPQMEARHTPTADQSWRRIDNDWLGIAADCALQLDSRTNNSSLVLAIDLVASGHVLLFAADAQVGNWRSWAGVTFPPSDTGKAVTGADLLARTILYKVGHHGSRNATLSEGGLELMTDAGLIAFIPTDETMAKKVKWKGYSGDRLARATAHADRRAGDPVGPGLAAEAGRGARGGGRRRDPLARGGNGIVRGAGGGVRGQARSRAQSRGSTDRSRDRLGWLLGCGRRVSRLRSTECGTSLDTRRRIFFTYGSACPSPPSRLP